MEPEPVEPAPESADFESLLAQVLDGAYRLAVRLCRSPSDAEDLVQEAALLAFRAFSSFRQGSNFKAWFYKILTNCFFASHRRAKRRPVTVDLDDASELYLYRRTAEAGLHAASDDPAGLVMSKLGAAQVMAAIDALPDEYRAVAALHFAEELKYEEIAEVLGCPVGTVRSRLHRSRRLLQKALWSLAVEAGIIAQLTSREAMA